MLPLVEVPELVSHYAPFIEPVFSEPAFEHFQRYVSGLILSGNKTVDGINRIFAIDTRNQSSLNRWLNDSPFSLSELNRARMRLLASLPQTRIKPKGVLSIDDTLLTHYGKRFEKIAWLYDHVEKRHVWAHNLVNLHYSDDRTDWPVSCRLWEPAEVSSLHTSFLCYSSLSVHG